MFVGACATVRAQNSVHCYCIAPSTPMYMYTLPLEIINQKVGDVAYKQCSSRPHNAHNARTCIY